MTKQEAVSMARSMSVVNQTSYVVFEREKSWTYVSKEWFIKNELRNYETKEVIFVNYKGGVNEEENKENNST